MGGLPDPSVTGSAGMTWSANGSPPAI